MPKANALAILANAREQSAHLRSLSELLQLPVETAAILGVAALSVASLYSLNESNLQVAATNAPAFSLSLQFPAVQALTDWCIERLGAACNFVPEALTNVSKHAHALHVNVK